MKINPYRLAILVAIVVGPAFAGFFIHPFSVVEYAILVVVGLMVLVVAVNL